MATATLHRFSIRRPRSGQFSRLLHFTSANVNKVNWATNIPTNVLSKYTWVRNGGLTAFLVVLSLYLGFGSVFSEPGVVVISRVPAFRVGRGLGACGIFGRPLFLLFASFFGFRLGGLSAVTHVRPQHDV